jgi:short-subunit dehydrogenase
MTNSKLALITGASSGIGLELAKLFANDGYDLVVAAEDDGIRDVPQTLSAFGVEIQPIQVDLRTSDGVEHLYRSTVAGDRTLAAAALNAGVGQGDMFLKTELADDMSIIDLNVRSTVHLAKLVVRDMANRDEGKVLFTSSVASMMPGSHQTVYNASKSFVQSFVEGLRDELRDTGITITSLMPGITDTNFFNRAGMLDSIAGKGPKEDPARVAKQGFDALMNDDHKVIGGSIVSKLMGASSAVLPDSVKAVGSRLLTQPRRN